MAVSFIFLILVALFVFGVIAAFVTLIVLAIVKGRGGAALVAGGLAFLGLLIGAALLFALFGVSSVETKQATLASETIVSPIQSQHVESLPSPITVTTDYTTWAIGAKAMLLVAIGIFFLLAYTARHGHAHAAMAGHHRAWPLGVGLLVLGFFLVGGIRYQRSMHSSVDVHGARAIEQMNRIKLQQQEQQKAIAERVASAGTKARKQTEANIHELMEKFDSPRIALESPVAPSSVSAELMAVASTESKSGGENDAKSRPSSKQKGSKKATAAAVERRHDGDSNTVAEVPLPTPAKEERGSGSTATDSEKTATTVRPAWVDSMPVRTSDLRREVIVTEEYESTGECFRAADIYLMIKAYERLQQLTGNPYVTQNLPSITFRDNLLLADGQVVYVMDDGTWNDSRLSVISRMGVTPEFLRSKIVTKDSHSDELHEYIETSSRSFGPMKRLHTQIEFTPAIDSELMRRSEALIREDRFANVGLGAGSVLGLLGMVWGLLKLDTATKGYYSKWLFIGVPAAIIGAMILSLFAFIA